MNHGVVTTLPILPTPLSSLEKKKKIKPPKNVSKEYFDITEFQNISRVIMQILSVVPLFSFSAH